MEIDDTTDDIVLMEKIILQNLQVICFLCNNLLGLNSLMPSLKHSLEFKAIPYSPDSFIFSRYCQAAIYNCKQ